VNDEKNIDTISEIQENHQAFKLNWTHQLYICADCDNAFGENVDSIQKNSGPVLTVLTRNFSM